MARCFRYDDVDATHAPDFFQVEGIVVSEKTSFRISWASSDSSRSRSRARPR